MNNFINIKSKKKFREEFKNFSKKLLAQKSFNTSLEDVDRAIEWYERIAGRIFNNERDKIKSVLVFEELFMNAYEHGNLKIDKETKAKYLNEAIYLLTLKKLEKDCFKKIDVKIYKLANSHTYIGVEICDEGEGFDIKNFDMKNKGVNGRGILMSVKNANIYYNENGNCVFFITLCT